MTLPPQQIQVVNALLFAGELSISQIADRLEVSRPVANELVDDLVQLGVVDRRMSAGDRRRRQVRLTVASLPDRTRRSDPR